MPHGHLQWVFLDRDGTINAKPPLGQYIATPAEMRLLDGSANAIQRLNHAGLWVGIATNQRGVALGLMTQEDVDRIHTRLLAELSAAGARVDAVYVCPHQEGTCNCRKPLPGLLLRAQEDVPGMDLKRAAIVGDSLSDVRAGKVVGASAILLGSNECETRGADHVAPTLAAAVDWLLSAYA